jgi:anti-sigma factor RsiW
MDQEESLVAGLKAHDQASLDALIDYLDGTLSPPEKVAAEQHLLGCDVCRRAMQSELLLARALSTRLTQAVESINLDANARRGITRAALQTSHDETSELRGSLLRLIFGRAGQRSGSLQPSVVQCWQRRLALSLAAAALMLLGALWIGQKFIPTSTANRHPSNSVAAGERTIPIHVSYSVPTYTFRREGNLVVDALTYDTRTMDGVLLAK